MRRSRAALFALVVASAMLSAAVFAATAAADDPIVAAAGDIACGPDDGNFNGGNGTATRCRQLYTSNQIVGDLGVVAVLPLGDLQYDCGGADAFLQSYNLSWGRVKSITRPVPGNHEYNTSGAGCDNTGSASGYYGYFGAAAGDPAKGYYSYNLGAWHLIALNSNCSRAGGCAAGSPQEQWLRQDLRANTAECTLAYWHHPLFSSGEYNPGIATVRPLFRALYEYHADVVLTGHDHNYERFAPQNPDGVADPALGIRQFIVGTGGKSLYSPQTPIANSEVRNSSSYGVLKLSLHPTSYEWRFVPAAGSSFADSGIESCDRPAVQAYARPRAARSASVALVPAYQECGTANASHGAPLASPSCSPTRASSPRLTIGTSDANGHAAHSTGRIELRQLGESPINTGNGDQSDVTITANLSDVRAAASPYGDYTGELQGQLLLRVTDRTNGTTRDQSGTVTDLPFSFTIPCQSTASAGTGSTCSVTTSVDGVMPGLVVEGRRSIWELKGAQVLDGGPDGVASTADNTVFLTQGFFTP